MSIYKPLKNLISIKIFMIIILVVILQSALLLFITANQLKENMVTGKIKDTHSELIVLQEMLQYLALKNEHSQIQKIITSLGIHIDLEQAFLLDEKNVVLASTRIDSMGKNIKYFLPTLDTQSLSKNFSQTTKHLKNNVWRSHQGLSLYAVSPIILGQKSIHPLRSDKVGILFLQFNLSWIEKQIQHDLWNHILPVVYILLFAGLSLGLYFHFSVSRRIKSVNLAALDFANNNYNTRLKIIGNDEITALGESFNRMAKQVQEHHQMLLKREQKLIHKETEQKHQEEQLRQSQKMDALGKLTGGIAHDYNNMLSVILGYTQLLKKRYDDENIQRYVDCIEEAATRSKKMTDKLLSFSRKRSSNTEVCDINETLRNDAEMLSKSLTPRIELKMDLCQSPWLVSLDISELQDVILNMAINAQHAMPDGGKLTFTSKTKRLTENEALVYGLKAADYMYLSIRDTGIGIDNEILAKIFDPFYTTKGEQGTGLGLSQAFGFVERSGGSINVNSVIAQGTEFEIYFPRYRQAKVKVNQEASIEPQNLTGNESILVVDDEPILRIMLSEILSHNGYTVLLADGSEQALEILNFNSDIVLMLSDVIMPKVDGFQLAHEVAQKYPNIKIQLLSGYLDERRKNKYEKKLVDNILYKPYNRNELLERVRSILDEKV